MTIKKTYYYLFYKLYKVAKTGAIKSLSFWYALSAIMILEGWFVFSLYNYYTIFINRYSSLQLKSPITIVFIILVLIINYFSFVYNDKWKGYVDEFDQWSKKRNIYGGLIVWSIIILITANLIFSFYLFSQIDWKQYR
jgi:hypothetical protein